MTPITAAAPHSTGGTAPANRYRTFDTVHLTGQNRAHALGFSEYVRTTPGAFCRLRQSQSNRALWVLSNRELLRHTVPEGTLHRRTHGFAGIRWPPDSDAAPTAPQPGTGEPVLPRVANATHNRTDAKRAWNDICNPLVKDAYPVFAWLPSPVTRLGRTSRFTPLRSLAAPAARRGPHYSRDTNEQSTSAL